MIKSTATMAYLVADLMRGLGMSRSRAIIVNPKKSSIRGEQRCE